MSDDQRPRSDDELDELIRQAIEGEFEGEPVLRQVLERFEQVRQIANGCGLCPRE